MAQVLKPVFEFLTPPPPPVIPEEYDGVELRWKMLTFRPGLFKVEGALLAVVAFYVGFHLIGRYINVRKAKKWLNIHLPIYETQFSRPTSAGLIRDGNSDFFNFSTGRRSVITLHTVFTMRPRHDIFQSLFHTLRGWVDVHLRPVDVLQLDFTLQSNALPYDFVFAIANKDELPWIKENRWDLNFTRVTENPSTGSQFVIMSEFADITENMFKLPAFQAIVKLLASPGTVQYFKSLSITDQPHLRPTSPSETQEKHLILSLKCPAASRSADTVALVTATFTLIDSLSKIQLRPETRNKLKATREDLIATIKKELEQEKEEEVTEDKKSAKRRAEEERIAKLPAAEQQKILERERKRSQRKHQGKVAIRK